jgi:hypothetical protein
VTTIPAGAPYTLKAEWLTHEGGPPAVVTDVTITITRLSDVTIVVGPTSTGVVHVATGLDVYSWTPDTDAAGDFAVVFDGLDTTPEAVQASEVITVGAADFSYDTATAVGGIRLLTSDTNADRPIFTDTEISAFYTLGGGRVRLGAAVALETLAGNEVMVSKVIRTLDLQTDGAKVSAELRALAKTLRDSDADYTADGDLFAIDIVDFQPDRWQLDSRWCP